MRIVIIDRHPEAARALAAALERRAGVEIAGLLDGVSLQALARLRLARVQHILLDTRTVGPREVRRLREEFPAAKIIALALRADRYEETAYVSSGADGYLEKSGSLVQLLLAAFGDGAAGRPVAAAQAGLRPD
jgi:DNA-binding NarL/FixJ family response regulator